FTDKCRGRGRRVERLDRRAGARSPDRAGRARRPLSGRADARTGRAGGRGRHRGRGAGSCTAAAPARRGRPRARARDHADRRGARERRDRGVRPATGRLQRRPRLVTRRWALDRPRSALPHRARRRRRLDHPRAADRGRGDRSRSRGDLQGARRRARRRIQHRLTWLVDATTSRSHGINQLGEDTMEKTVIRTEAAPAPFQGAPYNQAIRVGELVFVAGQLGLKPGDAAIDGDVSTQTEQVMRNLGAILEEAGSSLANLVKTTVFLRNLDDFAAMNEVYARHVGDRPPARATVEVSRLPSGALVEIEAVAHL